MAAEAARLSHGPPSYINDSDTLRTDTVNAESVRIQNASDRPSQIPSLVTLSHSQTSSVPHLPARAPAHLAADSSTHCNLPLLRQLVGTSQPSFPHCSTYSEIKDPGNSQIHAEC